MAEKSRLTREQRLTQLEGLEIPNRDNQTPNPKIQRVAYHLRDRKHFTKHYLPKLVSIGPIHHGEKHLQLGEDYKLMWTAMYVKSTQQTPRTLHKKIADNIGELKVLFTNDAIGDFNDEELSWMLFVDGCSLLQILYNANLFHPQELNLKVDQLALVLLDVLLLETQLPFKVLKLLSSDGNEATLIETMDKFLHCHHLSVDGPKSVAKQDVDKSKDTDRDPNKDVNTSRECPVPVDQVSPAHLLDHLRRTILHDHSPKNASNMNQKVEATKQNDDKITYRNIQELKAAGIRVKSSKTRCLSAISFHSFLFVAQLKLPEIIVDDTTAPTFLNLIAYEMCPDFQNNYEICSFVALLDSLIDHPDDVKELRSAGILHNALGSDEEVAKLFNTISTDLVPDAERYANIRAKINNHYQSTWKTWIAEGYHTYFSSPWAIIAFLAAFLALFLTCVQTWLVIFPP